MGHSSVQDRPINLAASRPAAPFPRVPSPANSTPKTYAALRGGVEHVLIAGRSAIEVAWVTTYHDIGRLINEHLLLNRSRATYGAQVLARLAADTQVSVRTLRECALFHRRYPIRRHVAKLGWNRCRLLCQVEDDAARTALTTRALASDLSSNVIVDQVRAINAATAAATEYTAHSASAPAPPQRLLPPKRGTPGLYRLVLRHDTLCVDLGFKLYLPLAPAAARHLTAGEIVRLGSAGELASAPDANLTQLFTYAATIRRVIDGDTLLIDVALPHVVMNEKLRLRGLDCPELDTLEGKAAKRVVDVLLAETTAATIVTSKVDKYDRYLADVHLRLASGEDCFLNNHLLAQGHAVRQGTGAQDDWVP